MPFAAFDVLRLTIVGSIVFLLSQVNYSQLGEAAIELFLIGRIPGSETYISFEAFFAGVIFVIWAIATYNFTLAAIARIHTDLKEVAVSQSELDEVAL